MAGAGQAGLAGALLAGAQLQAAHVPHHRRGVEGLLGVAQGGKEYTLSTLGFCTHSLLPFHQLLALPKLSWGGRLVLRMARPVMGFDSNMGPPFIAPLAGS